MTLECLTAQAATPGKIPCGATSPPPAQESPVFDLHGEESEQDVEILREITGPPIAELSHRRHWVKRQGNPDAVDPGACAMKSKFVNLHAGIRH